MGRRLDESELCQVPDQQSDVARIAYQRRTVWANWRRLQYATRSPADNVVQLWDNDLG